MNNCPCRFHTEQRSKIESYTYVRNEPKNQESVQLKPFPPSLEAYRYAYAMYKPSQNISYKEEEQEEQVWPGVV